MEGQLSNKEPKIEIALATLEDVFGIQDVFYYTWLSTYPNKEFGITVEDIEDRFKDRNSEEKLEKRKKQISNPPTGEAFYVAKADNKIVGVCALVIYEDKNQLQAIYVLPEYQGKGIGKLFWNEAQKFFDYRKDTVVQVATYNTNAIKFYEKLGFRDTGKRREDERHTMKSGSIIPQMEMILRADKK